MCLRSIAASAAWEVGYALRHRSYERLAAAAIVALGIFGAAICLERGARLLAACL